MFHNSHFKFLPSDYFLILVKSKNKFWIGQEKPHLFYMIKREKFNIVAATCYIRDYEYLLMRIFLII